MFRLSPFQYAEASERYRAHRAFFPLIAAVLDDQQEGVVFADSPANFSQLYVEHAFGFAQVFGSPVAAFESALQRYLLIDRAFAIPKVRLYTPYCPEFLLARECEEMRSWRQHFSLPPETSVEAAQPVIEGLVLVHVDASHLEKIDHAFGLLSRFWRTTDDFVRHANAVLALVNNQPAALCYAAAVAGGRAEIDVVTQPAFRQQGLAKAVVLEFNRRCRTQGLQPLWDCFTNNTASVALCQSTGFVPWGADYPFFTINR